MAYNSAPGRAEYTASATQTVFPFSFKIYSTSDIKVYQTLSGQVADDATDILIETTDYTVTINGDLGGDVTLLVGTGAGDAVTLQRELPIIRPIEYQQSGDLLASTLNTDQDYQTYLIADKEDDGARHLTLGNAIQGVSTLVPIPEALKLLGWSSGEDKLENFTIGDDTVFINIYNADSIADLLLADPTIYSTVNVRGYYTPNDGGGGVFNYDATQSAVNNGGTIINGWVRQYSEIINLKWFGAKGDDLTDDTLSFTNANLVSIANGEQLFIPNGTYLIDQYALTSGFNIIGEDRYNTELKLRTDTGSRLLNGNGISDITIQNISLNTRKSEFATLRTTVDINPSTAGQNVIIKDCYIPSSTSAGIVVDNTTNVLIQGNDVQDCTAGDCIRTGTCFDVSVIENNMSSLSTLAYNRRAIQIGSTTRFICNNNKIDGATISWAMDFGASSQGTIIGNSISRTLAMVDLEGGCNNLTISGNSFNGLNTNDGQAYGITIFENGTGLTATNCTISDNTISGVWHGIRVEGGRELTIQGNAIKDCWGHGISITDGQLSSYLSTNITLSGNSINTCSKSAASTYDGIAIKSDRAIVTGNFIRGANHRYDINSDAANTVCHIGLNYASTIFRGEVSSYIQMSNRKIFEGAINPEGSITASPGDLYLRSTGGAGTTLYVKETGTSNTGWVGK